jgi:hypothetical protein
MLMVESRQKEIANPAQSRDWTRQALAPVFLWSANPKAD